MGRAGFNTVFNNHLVTGDASVNSVKELFNRTHAGRADRPRLQGQRDRHAEGRQRGVQAPVHRRPGLRPGRCAGARPRDVQDGRQERIPQRAASHRRRHRHTARRRREHAGRQRLHRATTRRSAATASLRGVRTRRPSPRPEGRHRRRPPVPSTDLETGRRTWRRRSGHRATGTCSPAGCARRCRWRATPLLAIGGANAQPDRGPHRRPCQNAGDPARAAGRRDRHRRDRPDRHRTTASPSGRQRISANPSSDQQYVYLGDLYAQKGRETGDVAELHPGRARPIARRWRSSRPIRRAGPAWRGTS